MSNEAGDKPSSVPTRPAFSVDRKKLIGGVIGIILGIVVGCMSPPAGLTPVAMKALGVFAWAVTFWIFEVLPDYVTAIAMCGLWVVFQAVPFKVAFASFSTDTIWLLIAALGMGAAVTKSGLLKRLALMIMNIFPGNFKGQTLALIGTGTLIAPTIPSVTAKVAIVAPLAKAISDTMGYARKSKGAAGLFGAMFMGFGVNGPLFLSASFFCYTLRGLLPQAVQDQVTWTAWLKGIFPWGIVLIIGSYIAIQLLYRPKDDKPLPPGYTKQQLEALGPMSREEKITSIVLIVALLLWMTERVHGIAAALVAIGAVCTLIAFKVFDRPDFRAGIPWDSVVFIGGIINLSSVLPYVGVDKWLAGVLGPRIAPLMDNMYLFVIALAVTVYIVRFVLVSQVATITIFTILLTPFAVQAGINPWVPAIAALCSVNVWNVIYQNSTFLTAYYAAGDMVEFKHMVPLSFAYMIVSIIGLLACVPLWKVLGLIP